MRLVASRQRRGRGPQPASREAASPISVDQRFSSLSAHLRVVECRAADGRSDSYSLAVRIVHLPPIEDVIEHDVIGMFTDSCICGPVLTLTTWGQEYVYLLTHHALIA
jgi:hypothetical protein